MRGRLLDAENIACPDCGAAPGEPCRTAGKGAARTIPHAARDKAAQRADRQIARERRESRRAFGPFPRRDGAE